MKVEIGQVWRLWDGRVVEVTKDGGWGITHWPEPYSGACVVPGGTVTLNEYGERIHCEEPGFEVKSVYLQSQASPYPPTWAVFGAAVERVSPLWDRGIKYTSKESALAVAIENLRARHAREAAEVAAQ